MNNNTETGIISQEKYDILLDENAKLKVQVAWLIEQLKLSKRKTFGTSSERVEGQLTLLEEVEIVPPPVELEQITYTRKKKGKREEDLSKLPVERMRPSVFHVVLSDHDHPFKERNRASRR